MKLLAAADAFKSLAVHRRQQVWEAAALRSTPQLLRDGPVMEEELELELELPPAPKGEEIVWDYASLGLTLGRYPQALLRPRLAKCELLLSAQLSEIKSDQIVRACAIVSLHQQPETAKGTIFVSLEDATGTVQVLCWRSVREVERQELRKPRLLAVYGRGQREGDLMNLIALKLRHLTPWLGRLGTVSRNFR